MTIVFAPPPPTTQKKKKKNLTVGTFIWWVSSFGFVRGSLDDEPFFFILPRNLLDRTEVNQVDLV